VLKKAGIVVTTAAAGLLAVSPLAFAGDKDDHDGRDRDGKHINKVDDSNSAEGRGLVFIADNNVAVNNCTNTVREESVISIIDDVAGLLNILGKAEANDSAVQVCDQEAEVDDSIEQGSD
jgi:hypothetical protein